MNFFEEATLRLKQQLRVTEDKEVAEALGMSAGAWTKRKRRESFPEDKLFALAARRPDLNLDVPYILTGEKLTGLRKAEADFIASGVADRAARGKAPIPGADQAIAGIAGEERRVKARSSRLEEISRWLCIALGEEAFTAAHAMIQRYTLECSAEDRAAIDRVVAGLAFTENARKEML